uniref:C-type lectin domain-containing protein n=1 Tax=Eptatretus burgeri TaxID=7764 RepID=A0A8C4QZA0_EPTBU
MCTSPYIYLLCPKVSTRLFCLGVFVTLLVGSPANVHKTRIWIGLRKSREQCVQRDKLLRGFHWVSDEDDGSYSNWSKEPALSCTTEQNCSQKAMVLCRFTFQHMCDPIPLSGDECATNPCEMLCTNSHGSYHCRCEIGFVPDPQNGRACVPEDVCVLRNCEHGCVVGLGKKATCSCPSGFTLDGNLVNCTDIDECESSLCDQGCKNSVGSFRCFCRDGFELDHDGSTCFAVNEDGVELKNPFVAAILDFKMAVLVFWLVICPALLYNVTTHRVW